jgi:hypothetical protein
MGIQLNTLATMWARPWLGWERSLRRQVPLQAVNGGERGASVMGAGRHGDEPEEEERSSGRPWTMGTRRPPGERDGSHAGWEKATTWGEKNRRRSRGEEQRPGVGMGIFPKCLSLNTRDSRVRILDGLDWTKMGQPRNPQLAPQIKL